MNTYHRSPLPRRRFLRHTLVGAGALVAGVRFPAAALAQITPGATGTNAASADEIVNVLMAGNARFADGRTTSPHRTLDRVREVAGGQNPIAAFLSCADSRVPVEIVFDQGLGDVFVVRDAGNVVSAEAVASLEFGTAVLGARVLFVLGHTACGAVRATMTGGPVPGQISALYARIQPAVDAAGGDLTRAIEENVRLQTRLLTRASPVIRDLLQQRRLRVVGGVYDLASGRVRMLDV